MTTLQERLASLADTAPAPPGDPGLWERGRRYGRRRRTGTLVIIGAALVAIVAVAVVGWTRSDTDLPPADSRSGLRLPDRLYAPSPDTAGTDETGPIGPLTAVLQTKRNPASGAELGIAGLSGGGDYAFLDLPGWEASATCCFSGGEVELSPDGRKLAYWYRGETSGTPDRSTGKRPIVGLAVYDTVTGDLWRQPFPSPHGLQDGWLRWGGGALWFHYSELDGTTTGASIAGAGGSFIWHPETGELVERPDLPSIYFAETEYWSGGLLDRVGEKLRLWSADRRGHSNLPYLATNSESEFAISPSERLLASRRHDPVLEADSPLPGRITVDDVRLTGGTDAVEPELIPGDDRYDLVLGWRGEDHVVAGNIGDRSRIWSVDIHTGERELLMQFPWAPWDRDTHVATDAWSGPRYDAEAPPEPTDTRLLAAAQLPIVLAAGIALALWRRRVRP